MKCKLMLILSLYVLGLSAHPLHLSVTNIVLENGKLKVHLKTFVDDWETAYFHYHSRVIDFNDPLQREKPWFRDYLNATFSLAPGKGEEAFSLSVDSVSTEDESMSIEMSMILKEKINSLYIYHSLLTDIYPDQSNLVILKAGNMETGIKFDVNKLEEILVLK